MAGSPIIAGDAVILVCDQMSGSFMIALDRRTGRERWRRPRPGITVSWTTPMVFAPGGGADPQLIVLSSTRLDGYTLATGEPRWWMPLSSQGAIGTAVAHGDMVIVATLGANEPWMEPFEAALKTFDTDKDGKLSRAEYATEKGFGEHFGWVDADGNDSLDKAEYDDARAMGIGEYGVAAIKPAGLSGKVDPNAAAWRFKKNLPFVPTPVVYDGLLYMVKAGGIVTAIDPATGQATKEGRSKDAPGDYTASPIAADGKVFLASVNGKVTVLKAGREWDVLGVNDLGDEIHATPALSGGRIYVRTRGTLYCFGAPTTLKSTASGEQRDRRDREPGPDHRRAQREVRVAPREEPLLQQERTNHHRRRAPANQQKVAALRVHRARLAPIDRSGRARRREPTRRRSRR